MAIKSVGNNVSSKEAREFKLYTRRWGVLAAITISNMAGGAIFCNNAPVATTSAEYFEKDLMAINWFSLVYFVGSLPFTFLASFVSDKFGLLITIHTGAILNAIAAGIRALSTSNLIDDKDTQFMVGMFGQCIGAVANCFVLGLSPKVSQIWFSDSERGISTTIGTLARPTGQMITQVVVPFIVESKEDIPLNNYIWFAFSIFAEVCTIIFVTRKAPKTAPSESADYYQYHSKEPFITQVKICFSSLNFILLLISSGAGISFFFTNNILLQQMLCPLGYDEKFAGLANAMIVIPGFISSGISSYFLKRGLDMTFAMKFYLLTSAMALIFLMEFYLFKDREVLICVFCVLFGIFGVPGLPLSMELGVETIYPAEEAIAGTFIFMSGQLQSLVYILFIPAVAKETFDFSTSSCGSSLPYDYTLPLLIVMTCLVLSVLAFCQFFDTNYKRLDAEKEAKLQGLSPKRRLSLRYSFS